MAIFSRTRQRTVSLLVAALVLMLGALLTSAQIVAQEQEMRRSTPGMERGRGERDIGTGIGLGVGIGIGIVNDAIQQQRAATSDARVSSKGSRRHAAQAKKSKRAAKKPEEQKPLNAGPSAPKDNATPPVNQVDTSPPQTLPGDIARPPSGPYSAPVPVPKAATPIPEFHGYTHALTCSRCEDTCKSEGATPACKFGDTRNRKETVLEQVLLPNGNSWAKVRYDEEVCNNVTCRNWFSNVECCSYSQWQFHSYALWSIPTKDPGTGRVSYTPDISAPCSCGQLLEMAHDLSLSGELDKGSEFIEMAKDRCPGLGLAEAQKMAQTCGFGPEMKDAMKLNLADFLHALIGLAGAAKGESGPGWSAPPPATVPVPDPVPIPGGFGWTPPEKAGPVTPGR
jgi:hypothetical protein